MKNKIYIIGAGKTGSSLLFELAAHGFDVAFLADRNESRLSGFLKSLDIKSCSSKIESEFVNASDIIFICVQDKYLKDVVRELERLEISYDKKILMHMSGSESTDVFSNEKFDKRNLLSMHPIQTFNQISYENTHLMEKIYFGIEGGDNAKKTAVHIIKKFGSKFIEIPKEKKYMYHCACVITSNYLVTLLSIVSEIISSIGIDKNKMFEIFKPIIDRTLSNISENGLVNSLTGPFERNDIETISNHLKSIKEEIPSLIPFYTLLGMETVKVAFKKESLNLKNVMSILDLMNEYVANESIKTIDSKN